MSVGMAVVGPHPSAAGEAIIGATVDCPASMPRIDSLFGWWPAIWPWSWLFPLSSWGAPEIRKSCMHGIIKTACMCNNCVYYLLLSVLGQIPLLKRSSQPVAFQHQCRSHEERAQNLLEVRPVGHDEQISLAVGRQGAIYCMSELCSLHLCCEWWAWVSGSTWGLRWRPDVACSVHRARSLLWSHPQSDVWYCTDVNIVRQVCKLYLQARVMSNRVRNELSDEDSWLGITRSLDTVTGFEWNNLSVLNVPTLHPALHFCQAPPVFSWCSSRWLWWDAEWDWPPLSSYQWLLSSIQHCQSNCKIIKWYAVYIPTK